MSNSELGLINIVDMGGDSRAFPINGNGLTAREVIAEFYNVEADEVSGLIASKSFRLVNRGPIDNDEKLDRQLAHGDTITVYANEVATGGVKGASESAEGETPPTDGEDDESEDDVDILAEAEALAKEFSSAGALA